MRRLRNVRMSQLCSTTPPGRFGARALARATQVSLVVYAALLAAGALGTAPLLSAAEPAQEHARFRPTVAQMAGLQIEVARAHRFVDRVVAEGMVASNDDATTPVFSPFSGRVVRLVASPGAHVSKGEPLMIVQASEIVQGLNDLRSAAASLNTAHAQLDLARTTEQRQHQMFDSKAGAFKDWLQAQSDLVGAGNAAQTAENALLAARGRLRLLGKSDAEITALEQGTRAGDPQAAEAPVRAPIDGVVIQRQVGLGQYIASVTGGATAPVYTVGDLSKVWIVGNVREADAARVAVGQPVQVSVMALPQRTVRTRIDWVAAALDPATRRLAVRGEADNRDGVLRPMMQAQLSIEAGHPAMAAAVPASALVFDGAQAHVWIAEADGSLALRPVRTGRSDGDWVELVQGLAAGERVVTRGTLFLDQAAEGSR